MEKEAIHGDERLGCPRRDHIRRWINAQPVPGYFEAVQDGNVQGIQFGPALESFAESLDDPPLQNWTGAMDHDLGNDPEYDDERDEADSDPSPQAFSTGSFIRCTDN